MSEQITINVSPSGMVKIDADGYQGNACSLATQQIEIAIGGRAAKKSMDPKPEFNMPATTAQTQKSTF